MQVISNLLPNFSHWTCCQHIWKNFLKRFSNNGLCDLSWDISKATTTSKFRQVMLNIRAKKRDAFDWLERIDATQWLFHAMDPKIKMEHITSYFVESFNVVVEAAMYKPSITLLETIRIKIMDIIYTRKMIFERWTKS